MNLSVFTIGHSRHGADEFRDLLAGHKVTAVADIRSSPDNPHFNREKLRADLKGSRVAYRELQLPELFRPRDHELVDEAYGVRGDEIAYVEKEITESEPMRRVA